jgi:signal transduction histidine kinase
MRELAERKRNEIALTQAKIQAETANIAKTHFLSTISHEIRTPMNGILGMAQLLLAPDLEEQERQEYAQVILKSGENLLNILSDIIDISKVEAGKVLLEPIEFKPSKLINAASSLFSESALKKSLKLQSTWLGAPEQSYMGDAIRAQQMLTNLINNAIKFTPQGTVQVLAQEVERAGQSATLEFSVTDTGIGISKEKLSLLFLPFSQVDSSVTRKYGGTGLGLSIVQGFAKLMNGTVGVESHEGKGSKFWFRIQVRLVNNN